jgi:hypothetical protein
VVVVLGTTGSVTVVRLTVVVVVVGTGVYTVSLVHAPRLRPVANSNKAFWIFVISDIRDSTTDRLYERQTGCTRRESSPHVSAAFANNPSVYVTSARFSS